MAKWNPFENTILNADPNEFAGQDDSGYGVPRDADSSLQGEADSIYPSSHGSGTDDTPSEEEKNVPAQEDAGAGPGSVSSDAGAGPGSAPAGSGSAAPSEEAQTGSDAASSAPLHGTGAQAGSPGDPGMGTGHDFEEEEPKFDTQTGERLDKPKKKLPSIFLTIAVSVLAVGAFIYSVKPGSLPSQGTDRPDPSQTETTLAIAADGAKTQKNSERQTEQAAAAGAKTQKDTERQTGQAAAAGAKAQKDSERQTEQTDLSAPSASTRPVTAQEPTASTVPETQPEDRDQAESGNLTQGRDRTKTGNRTQNRDQTENKAAPRIAAAAGTKTESESDSETETEARTGRKGAGPSITTNGVTVSASLDVSDMVEEVMPEIVSVTATSVQRVRDFFYGEQEILQTDAGSGIIIERDDRYLYIVTDAFIVRNAQDVTVGFCVKQDQDQKLREEDTVASAEVMGIDEESLLAVVRVPLNQINKEVLDQVKKADLGDSDAIRVGQRVFAIGNAMGRGLSVTQGIISAVERSMRYGYADHEFIQTDASINYGNYGGALLNDEGEVIGINAGKITEDSSEGMGFAFPVNDAKEAIGRVLGDSYHPDAADEETEEAEETEETEETEEQEAGKETEQPLTLALAQEPGSEAQPESGAPSSGQESETQAASEQEISKPQGTAQEDETDSAASSQGQLGIQVGEYSKEDQIIYRIPSGVVVADVTNGSGAQAAGLITGDLITGINDTPVTSVVELKDALSGLRAGDRVKVTFIRPDGDSAYKKDSATSVTVTLQ